MRKSEIEKRLETMSPLLLAEVQRKIKEGNGAHTISLETDATLKQINAVFASMERSPTEVALENAASVLNSVRVKRSDDGSTIFIPLPRALWKQAGTTPCHCPHCDGKKVVYYDTLAVAAKRPDRDFTWTVHYPSIQEGR